MILNNPFLGMPGNQLLGMPDRSGRTLAKELKEAAVALVLDKSIMGAAIDARIAEAVKKVPASGTSGGINASSVDSKIKTALEGVDAKIAKAVEGVDAKIKAAGEGHLTSTNLGKMRITTSGGGRRGSKRAKRGKRGKRGTKRR